LYRDFLRGAAFVDAGTLERAFSQLRTDRIRVTTGFGFRIRAPGWPLPISLYFATPLKKEHHDKREAIIFNIGTGFEF